MSPFLNAGIIDLSHPLAPETSVFPDYPPVAITILDATDKSGDDDVRHLNSSYLGVGIHCGTHLDAPFHFFGEGATVDAIPLENCVGPAVIVRVTNRTVISRADLLPYKGQLRGCGKVLINTGWHHRWGQHGYFTEHPVMEGDAAAFLVECGIHLVGVDFPSVDRPPFPAHLVLLGSGVLIVENLTNMDALAETEVMFVALPLKITGRDGSPVRAIAFRKDSL